MPYIKHEDRSRLDVGFENFPTPQTPGELNYCVTQLVLNYQKNCVTNYQMINDVVGALEGAKLEFYRRVAAPYEDKKIVENGDVY